MSTVLWGARRGDTQYASRDYWRRNIPFGAWSIIVDSSAYFDVGATVDIAGTACRIVGKERRMLGVHPL